MPGKYCRSVFRRDMQTRHLAHTRISFQASGHCGCIFCIRSMEDNRS